MSTRLNDREICCHKRELHLRIGRSRRAVERRLHATSRHAGELLSWRRYVARYPGLVLMAALGGGMAVSTMFRPARVSRWLGRALVDRALAGVGQRVWDDVAAIWRDQRKKHEQGPMTNDQ